MEQITKQYIVTEEQTAQCMGSGDMPVLATPALVAMMENAAMELAASHLPEGDTTVGAMINTTHLKPSAVNAIICVTATLTAIDGRKMTFSIEAKEKDGDKVVGKADHLRCVVTRERFLEKL